MELTRVERWTLSNQFKILERLNPEEADYYRRGREALDSGYAREYAQLAQSISADKDCLSSDECGEVVDILLMFCELRDAYEALGNPQKIEGFYIDFWGFDGNEESTRLGYCRYLMADERHTRFHRLKRGDDWNSHMPALDGYQRMLGVWRPIRERAIGRTLTEEEAVAIISERPAADSEIGQAMRIEGPRH